jgi:transposase-like protein
VLSNEVEWIVWKEHAMATDRMALVDVVRKGQDPEADFLKEGVRWLVQELMEAQVSAQIGAERYERSEDRTAQRNGYRTRHWDTRVGTLERAIPKLRTGSYFPSWLEARKRSEQALVAVVAEAYVQGVSTRKVEALVQTLGIGGISKSEVSRMAASLDAQVAAFRTRRLDAEYPYVWVDARYEYVREDHRVQSMAVVIAYGVRADGVREVLGLEIGLSEDVILWREFLQSLVARCPGCQAGDQRCASRPQASRQGGVPGGRLATLQSPCHAQPARARAQERPSHGGRDRADHLRPGGPRRCRDAAPAGDRGLAGALP